MTRPLPLIVAGLAALAMMLPASRLAAQETPAPSRVSLATAVRRAFDHDPVLGASVASGEAAHAAVGEARARWFPVVALTGSATQFQEPMIATPIHGFEPDRIPPFDETLFSAGVTLQYTLFDGGARGARVRGARARADAALAAVDEAAQGLVARVVRGYLAVLGSAQVLDAHERRLAALDAELGRVRLRRDAGKAADVEVLRVEAVLAAARADRVHTAAALDVAERELARLMGVARDTVRAARLVPVAPDAAPVPDREELMARALVASPSLDRARREHAAAVAGRAMAGAARWPSLDLVGGYVDRGGLETKHQLEWNVGVQLSYPLFTGGAVSGAAARADAESRAAAQRVRAGEQHVEGDVDRALAAVEETGARVASLETAATRFAEVVRIELLRLDAGSGTQTDYLNAEADLLAARAALVEARHGAIAARVDLARVIGALDLAWVDRLVENTQ